MPPTEAEIRALLNSIPDPCARIAGMDIGIGDFGLVREVGIDSQGNVCAVIALTGPNCFYAVNFIEESRRLIADMPGVRSASVELDTSYTWTEANISPAARQRLARMRAERLAERSATPASARQAMRKDTERPDDRNGAIQTRSGLSVQLD